MKCTCKWCYDYWVDNGLDRLIYLQTFGLVYCTLQNYGGAIGLTFGLRRANLWVWLSVLANFFSNSDIIELTIIVCVHICFVLVLIFCCDFFFVLKRSKTGDTRHLNLLRILVNCEPSQLTSTNWLPTLGLIDTYWFAVSCRGSRRLESKLLQAISISAKMLTKTRRPSVRPHRLLIEKNKHFSVVICNIYSCSMQHEHTQAMLAKRSTVVWAGSHGEAWPNSFKRSNHWR